MQKKKKKTNPQWDPLVTDIAAIIQIIENNKFWWGCKMFWKQCLKTLLKLKPLGVAGENVQWHPTVEDNTVVPLKIKQRGFWEDSRMGCTRNPSLHLDNNCTGRICLIQLFWNSGVYWRLQLPGEGLDGKLCLISVTFSLLAQQHLTIPKPLWQAAVNNLHTACRSQGGQ